MASSCSPMAPAEWVPFFPSVPLPVGWQPRPDSVAYHEAGHAVVALTLRLPVAGAAIGQGRGVMTLAGPPSLERLDAPHETEAQTEFLQRAAAVYLPDATARDRALAVGAMLAAGVQAELLHAGMELPGVLTLRDDDTLEAREVLRQTFGHDMHWGSCQHRARALLRERWPEVEVIAAALLDKGEWRPSCLAGSGDASG